MILKPQVSDGPKLNLVREGAERYTTKEGNLTALLNQNLQCDDNFQAHSVGGSTQGPASGILATETETERRGEVKLGQHLQGLDSLQFDALLSLSDLTGLFCELYIPSGPVLLNACLQCEQPVCWTSTESDS